MYVCKNKKAMSSSLNLRLEILNCNKALNLIEGKFKFKHDIFKL